MGRIRGLRGSAWGSVFLVLGACGGVSEPEGPGGNPPNGGDPNGTGDQPPVSDAWSVREAAPLTSSSAELALMVDRDGVPHIA